MTRRDIWAGLPAPDCRFSYSRKQQIAQAIRSGLISLGEAREYYGLSTQELLQWHREAERRLPKGRHWSEERRQAVQS